MSYPGSKGQAGVWQRIIGQMPPHSLYIEPFAGSAQVFFRKAPARRNILIEADASAHARLSVAAGNDARFGVPGRASVDVIHGTGIDWLSSHGPDCECILCDGKDNAVIYCDPPYLLSTRLSRRYYRHEMTDADHAALILALRTVKARVLLSGYPSALYSSQLRDWRCCSYQTRTRGRTVTECLWMNFPEPTELHDWRYAGQTHRQRVSFKRLAARWLAKLDRMKPRQRGYLLATIAQRRERQRIPVEAVIP